MLSFFATKLDDGYGGFTYEPTLAGYLVIIVLILLLIFSIGLLWKNPSKKKICTKQITFSAIAIALATVTSMFKIIDMPMGGSVTLFSMLFICLIGYWYGLGGGLMAAISYGLLQLIIDPYIISVPQLLIDYICAFGALGLSGLMRNKKNGLPLGYLIGVFGRFIFSVLSGIIFFGTYAPESMGPWIYSICYNGAYLGLEAVLTIIVISLPPVKKALETVRQNALSNI